MRGTIAVATILLMSSIGYVYAQSGPGYRTQTIIAAAGTAGTQTVMHTDSGGTAIPACFRFGSTPIWQANGNSVGIAYTMDRGISFVGDLNTATGHHLSDTEIVPNRVGPAIGLRLDGTGRSHSGRNAVDYNQVYRAPGARAGLCTIALETPSGSTARFPCGTDTECSTISAGTCESETSFLPDSTPNAAQRRDIFRQSNSCVFARVQTDVAGTILTGNP